MKVASLSADVLLCTHFSQALRHQAAVVTPADCLSTERILAAWNCLCRQGTYCKGEEMYGV